MSSITERFQSPARPRDSERGQALVIFAGGLVAIIAIAALVFDTGQSLLDRRTEQNAADSAALAGARYVTTSTGIYQGDCAARTPSQKADHDLKHVNTACDVATEYLAAEGFASSHVIEVKSPPGPETDFSGAPETIEVQIYATRPSFFAGILGFATQDTGALAVAMNSDGYSLPYSLIALDPTGCSAGKVTGGGSIVVGGTIHVDSNCDPGAFLISGTGAVTALSCDAVGDIQVTGGGTGCTVQHEAPDVTVSGDPLAGVPAPAIPANLGHFVQETGATKAPPATCPSGAASSSVTAPLSCTFGSSYSGRTYRMWPGYYPGGINLNAGTFLMEPGIYYIGGGGFRLGGNGVILQSVDAGTTTVGGGVLIFDTAFSDPAYCTSTAPGTIGSGCIGDIRMNGAGAIANLEPIETTIYKNMLIFVDRITTDPRLSVILNGADTDTTLEGTVYAPTSIVILNGSAANSIATQVISYDFQVNGSGGNLTVTYDSDKLFQLSGVGLVQ